MTIENDAKPAQIGEAVLFEDEIVNNGSVSAKSVSLILEFSYGMFVNGHAADDSSRTLVVNGVGDLEVGQTYEFSFTATPTKITTLVATATASSQSLDENNSDNQSSLLFNVGFAGTPNSVNVLELESNDAVDDSFNELIIVTTRDTEHDGLTNRVLGIDPHTGLVERIVALPGEGGDISISDDGSVLFVLSDSHNHAYRIDWESETHTSTVNFPDTPVDDLEILPGKTDSIIVGGTYGVRVYDNGVLRQKTSGTYNGDQVELLPDPNLVFGYDTESFKFEIDASGVNTLVTKDGLFSGFRTSLEADGYYVYGSGGKVVRADIMTVAGQFDLGPMGGTSSVEPERALQRVYSGNDKEIGSYDSETQLFIRSLEFPSLSGDIETLERWGADGVVSVLSNGFVAIIRTDLIPDEASTIDLLVNLEDGDIVHDGSLTISGAAFTGQGIEGVDVNGVSALTSDAYATWSVVVDLERGDNEIRITADPFVTGAPRIETITIVFEDLERIEEQADAVEWIAQSTGRSVDVSQLHLLDSDRDGRSDLGEFLVGTSADGPDGSSLDLYRTDAGWEFSFVHRESSTFEYRVMLSKDLVNWEPAEAEVTRVGDPTPLHEKQGYARSTFRLIGEALERCFIRIDVESSGLGSLMSRPSSGAAHDSAGNAVSAGSLKIAFSVTPHLTERLRQFRLGKAFSFRPQPGDYYATSGFYTY